MSEKVALKIMRCPTCGGTLKAKNDSDAITCVYCGNTIVPVTEAAAAPRGENAGPGGTVKVEGIRTPSSAVAYIELFFEDYDWDSFAYAQTLSVSTIDALVNSLKCSSADDKNTWFACFQAVSVPFVHKVSGCRQILSSVIEEYKKDDLDAYSRFDAYKRIAAMIASHKAGVLSQLEKVAANAAKYGASSVELNVLMSGMDNIRGLAVPVAYSSIESIPEVKRFIEEKNAKIARELANKGIDAEREYARAKLLIKEKRYVEALNILRSLDGYSDTRSQIEKLDKYFLIADVLEVEGELYYFKADSYSEGALSLHPTVDGKIAEKPIIQNIGQMITNYADILYYLDGQNRLHRFDLSAGAGTELLDKSVDKKSFQVYDRRAFLLVSSGQYEEKKNDIAVLDLVSGTVQTLVENVKSLVSLTDNKLVYTLQHKIKVTEFQDIFQTSTHILNVDTMTGVDLGVQKVQIEGFLDECVVYTKAAPNEYNKNLYIRALDADSSEKLIEQNIYKFCDIIDGKLFYYIGNSKNQSLINIERDGTGRKEWPLYISDVLFEQGGWLYFIRRVSYNAILCKARVDGSGFSVIAADIDTFIEIKNGYLYYINDDSKLVKVRMDGSNLQELCDDVESVLSVQEDKIIFISVDDRIKVNAFDQVTTKTVKSIYAVDFSGSGKIKLAYNIKTAKEYDDNTVYYVATKGVRADQNREAEPVDMLFKLDVRTNRNHKLLDVEVQEQEQKSSGFMVAMVIMAIGFFFALIGLAGSVPLLGVIGMMVGLSALLIGLMLKPQNKDS